MKVTQRFKPIVRAALFAAGLTFAFNVPALAQDYPTRPVRIIVPFGPGTGLDIIARVMSPKLSEAFGQPFVVDNKPGATGIIGTEAGARAAPDGHTLTMVVSATFGINPGLYAKLPYDPLRDFEPITNLAFIAQTLLTHPSFGANSVQEFVKIAKANSGKLSFATLGIGATGHLTMEMFKTAAGFNATPIPFKGSADAQTQVINGQIPFMFESLPTVLPHIKSGKVRALAVSTPQRSPFLPDVPTIAESGYPGFASVGWIGIVAPARTPASILDKLNSEMVRILNTPETKERLDRLAFTPIGDSRETFRRYIQAEMIKWAKAIKDAGVKPQ